MQKQDTAIYVPIKVDKLESYFLNRVEAFRLRFDAPADVLTGYKRYDDAVKAGRSRFAGEKCFGILSISFNEHVRNALSLGQLIDGESVEDKTNAPLWLVLSKGAELLAQPNNAAMWVQIVAVKVEEEKKPGGGAGNSKPNSVTSFEPMGPTGFGC